MVTDAERGAVWGSGLRGRFPGDMKFALAPRVRSAFQRKLRKKIFNELIFSMFFIRM